MKPQRGQLVEIHWIDSCMNTGWQSEKDVVQWASNDAKAVHHSSGYFVTYNEKVVVIASSYADFENNYRSVSGAMSIPLVAILRMACL